MQCPTRVPCLLRRQRVPQQGHRFHHLHQKEHHHQRGPSPLLFLLRLHQKEQVREPVAKPPARSSAQAPCFLRHHQRSLLLLRRTELPRSLEGR